MDLSTRYLGLSLRTPLVASSSPLTGSLDSLRRLEDAGVAAVVLPSLFEEELTHEALAVHEALESGAGTFAEATDYLPDLAHYDTGPDAYLELVHRAKQALAIPVIASLNGATLGGWTTQARLLEKAGADALELNLYQVAADPSRDAAAVEAEEIELVEAVRAEIEIPLAVKLSPFYTALAHFADSLEEAGAEGLVLFNRFYQPDIDVDALEASRSLKLSDPSELLLRLRWLAILSPRVKGSLAVSGGVHDSIDAVKAIMTGAHGVQMVSALLRHGPEHLARVRNGLREWLEQHEYDSIEQMRGSMNLKRCPDPRAYERANYVTILQSWRFDLDDSWR